MCLYGTYKIDFVLSLLNKHARTGYMHRDFLSRVFTSYILVYLGLVLVKLHIFLLDT